MVSRTMLLRNIGGKQRTNNRSYLLENKLVIHLRDDVVDLDSHLVPGHQVDHLGVGPSLQGDDSN